MRKQTDIFKSFWNQIIIWLPLFLHTHLYAPQGHTSWQNDLSIYIIPLSMMAVAYTNYFVLAPMLLKGRKKEFLGNQYTAHPFLIYCTARMVILHIRWAKPDDLSIPNLCRKQRGQVRIPTRLFLLYAISLT